MARGEFRRGGANFSLYAKVRGERGDGHIPGLRHDAFPGRLRAFGCAAEERNVGPPRRQRPGDAVADAAVGAGHGVHPAGEVCAHFQIGLPEPGSPRRGHFSVTVRTTASSMRMGRPHGL